MNRNVILMVILVIFVSIGIFASVLFFLMEENVIQENQDYVSAHMTRTRKGLEREAGSLEMEEMISGLYEGLPGEWSCFVDLDGSLRTGDAGEERAALLGELVKAYEEKDSREDMEALYKRVRGHHLVAAFLKVQELGGILVSVKDITESMRRVSVLRALFLLFMAAVLAVVIFFTNRIQRLMQENLDRELLAKNSQIRALQNQINAHFIYNVLETIKMMAELREEYVISDAVTSLGKLLRYNMKWTGHHVRVEEELEYIRNYLALINLRFDYSILLSLKLSPEAAEQEIPKMCLQPIVENAILHGIEEVAEDATIYMKGDIQGDVCVIEITDNGKGMSEEKVREVKEKISGRVQLSEEGSGGIGLKNVQDRITMAFGPAYGLDIISREGCFTKVILRLPASRKESTK